MFSATKPLVLRTLKRPVRRALPVTSSTDRAAALAAAGRALRDTRDTSERVVDAVVDRLLKELSW